MLLKRLVLRTLLQQGKVEDAKKLCDQALLVNADNPGLWSLRINIEKLDETSLARYGALNGTKCMLASVGETTDGLSVRLSAMFLGET